jgi:hypothetical protein
LTGEAMGCATQERLARHAARLNAGVAFRCILSVFMVAG